MLRPALDSPLFPYTTLFRSQPPGVDQHRARRRGPPAVVRRVLLVRQQAARSEEHTSELQSPDQLVCRLLLEKNNIVLGTRHETAVLSTPRALHGTLMHPAPK